MFEIDFDWIFKHLMYCVWGISIIYIAKFAVHYEKEYVKSKFKLFLLLILTGIQGFGALSYILAKGINFFIVSMIIYFVYIIYWLIKVEPIQNEKRN